jgi:hypothetical protein
MASGRFAQTGGMAQTRLARFDWLPAVALSGLLAAAVFVWHPLVGDLAAQVFRTELFQRGGLAIWNGSWYGGHYTLTYSVLFPPLAAMIGPRLLGGLAVVGSSYLFDRLIRDRWGDAARLATLWFAAGVVTVFADGQLTFALGVAFALGSLRALQLGRGRAAAAAAAACALSSPVAAAFLGGIVLVGTAERGRPFSRVAIWVAAIALGLTFSFNLAFPESGLFPFSLSSFIAIPLWCLGAIYVTRGLKKEERQLRWAVVAYTIASFAIWLSPNPIGGNAVRLGALFGGPVLAAVVLSRKPRVSVWLLALFMAGSLYWQVTASVQQIARSAGDPATSASYFQPVASWLQRHGGREARIEVPPTADHWEAAYLAPRFELARGWLRQAETTRDDLFYDEGRLNSGEYEAWLRENAVRFVALPDAPLDYSSAAEKSLILSGPPYLALRWRSAHWRVYSVRHPQPLVDPIGGAAAAIRSVGAQGFSLNVTRPGDFLVRVNFTPYWSVEHGEGCLLRRGDWTLLRTTIPGAIAVTADFSLGRAWNAVTGGGPTC